jgi:alpha-tubulin suppressor-like RCC1 family protein
LLLRGAVLSILGLGFGLACSDITGPKAHVIAITIPNFRRFMEVGESFRFTAVVTGEGAGQQVVWTSSNPAVVRIDQSGLAVARAPGSADIQASLGGSSSIGRLVIIRPIFLLSVNPGNLELVPGDKVLFAATATDAAGAPVTDDDFDGNHVMASVVWTVGDSTVAGPMDPGHPTLLTALREGTTTIQARLSPHVGTTTLTARALDAADLTAGGTFNCAVTTDSLPFCWGAVTHFLGSPGTGWWTPKHVPHAPGTRLAFALVSAGGWHACGLAGDGLAYCWGSNEFGALGNGSADQPTGPVRVSGGLRFTKLTAGGRHTCGITTDGRTFCWGARYGAAEGAGPDVCGSGGKISTLVACSRAPLLLGDGSDRFTSLAAGGRHTCGVDAGGQAACWGLWGSRAGPAPITVGGPPFTSLTSGDGYSCGLTSQGMAHCWGTNSNGQLGDGSTTPRDEPAPVAGGLTFTSLSAGRSESLIPEEGHVCGLTQTGDVHCWGRNQSGQLGSPASAPHASPTPVPLVRFRSVQAGSSHTCGLSLARLVYCWGANLGGQLGVSGVAETSAPVVVAGQRTGAP